MSKRTGKPYHRPEPLRLRAAVVHGELRYARHPIVVGHYEGDTIVGAEAQIDSLLGGALSQRYALGLYPGEFGSLAMVLRKATALQTTLSLPSAAIVMGLGKWGDLTSGQLADLLRRAALQYVLALGDSRDTSAATPAEPVGLSVLLIGGNSATNIDIGDSVGAILRGIAHANRELADDHITDLRIDEVEIIELYSDSAIAAAHACKRLAESIGKEFDTVIEAADWLQRGREGRARLTSAVDRDAWRRWEVSVVTPFSGSDAALRPTAVGSDEPEVYREIRFLTLSDRARAEATSQQRQPELMERLIKDSISHPEFRAEESRVLFELTIPNDLKSGLAQIDNLVLVVDAESAAYPWELMSAGDKPLCVAKSLVRQLQTARFRPQISARAGMAAYVVGDPRVTPPLKQLPGARDEAETVYKFLSQRFDIDPPAARPTALDVLAGLYEKPYRIVHLAGHGQYEPPSTKGGRARSGLVLDNGVFLTAVEIGQMQQVPELVFLNCCHIGQTGPQSSAPGNGVEYNRLAASISRELIEMGVRAVVAAGWAVDDVAAPKFAEVFYSAMLDGKPFGHALTAARQYVHERFPTINTWGAYQAYGDPDYRLDPESLGISRVPTDRVDAAELIEAVRAVGRRATDAGNTGDALRAASSEITQLVAESPQWLGQTDVLMQLAYTLGDIHQFDAAVQYLRKALDVEDLDSAVTLHAVEQLANYEARLADIADIEPDRARQMRESAITRLKALIAVNETAERYCLLGSAYKRVAAAETDVVRARAALTDASHAYSLAHQRNARRQAFDTYPVLNWLTAAFILDEPVPDGDELLDRCEAIVAERFADDHSFFSAIGIAESRLLRVLRGGRLGEQDPAAAAELADIESVFRQVIAQTAPNGRELNSVYTQIDAVCALLAKLSGEQTSTTATISRLMELRQSIGADAHDAAQAESATAAE